MLFGLKHWKKRFKNLLKTFLNYYFKVISERNTKNNFVVRKKLIFKKKSMLFQEKT